MKRHIIQFGAGLILLLLTLSCTDPTDNVRNRGVEIKKEDVLRFKKEIESLNDTNHVAVQVKDSSKIVYADERTILDLKDGIVLFGWPTCPWFRNAVEPLLEFALEEDATIYYLDIKKIRDKKELKDGEIVTIEEGSEGYTAILNKFHTILNPYKTLGVDSVKRISSPTVLFIQDGQAVHKVASTVASQSDPHIPLTQEQRTELKQRYRAFFAKEVK